MRSLERAGARVTVSTLDVVDAAEAAELMVLSGRDLPVATVFHLAMYLDDRLLASRNRNAPVECAVCHVDSDAPHWSCSWCALRMCSDCRRALDARGPAALNERIRRAEMGIVAALNASSDSGLALGEAEMVK